MALDNIHLTKVARMLDSHLAGLLAYIRLRVTNAITEGMNASIQRLKSNSKGFRKFTSFRVAILFFLGSANSTHSKAHRRSFFFDMFRPMM